MSGDANIEPSPFSSAIYWEDRYASGKKSGAGSYRHLADYKAQFINQFVSANGVETVLELGCGDGNQLGLLNFQSYVGVDVAPTVVERCRKKFADRKNWRFADAADRAAYSSSVYDLTLSLDVIYHLIEDDVFNNYMTDLFDLSSRFVVIYASDWDEVLPARHVRHRWFSDWISRNRPDWVLSKRVQSPYRRDPQRPRDTTFAEFHVIERRAELTLFPDR